MYRYSVDGVISYTAEDFILFKESPFASWMERLTLENPNHGISPDLDDKFVGGSIKSPYDPIATLIAQGRTVEPVQWGEFILAGHSHFANKAKPPSHITDLYDTKDKDVAMVEWHMSEPQRRMVTLEAMQRGADFIVNGQLSMGPLSGAVNLLIRSGGISELGDYLYIPCDTLPTLTLHGPFRLCYIADLLHCMQGTLPPQILIIREGKEITSLQTADHIHHFRAVKHLFMTAQLSFRKHCMPDPAESAHFGRWSGCAYDLIKRRALSQERRENAISVEKSAPGVRTYAQACTPWNRNSDISVACDPVGAVETGERSPALSWSEAPSPKLRPLVRHNAMRPPSQSFSNTPVTGESMIDHDVPASPPVRAGMSTNLGLSEKMIVRH